MNNARSFVIHARQRGMSLIEVLVGLAIGVIAMLIMFQLFYSTGESSRTTGSGNEAQIAGTLGLYQLERDIMQAGYGFGLLPIQGIAGGVAGCAVAAHNEALATPDFAITLTPVEIVANASGPDEIRVLYGDSAFFVGNREFNDSATTSKALVRRDAFTRGDLALVTDMGTNATGICAIVEITGDANADGVTVDHVPGASYFSFPTNAVTTSTFNASAGTATLVASNGYLYNLGHNPVRNIWRVTPPAAPNPNMLVRKNWLFRADTETVVTDGIADLKAEYGLDTLLADQTTAGRDGRIGASEWSNVAPADWSRLLALRFALLARSQHFEKDPVTTSAPTWANGSRTFVMRHLDGSVGTTTPGGPNDWRHYRYRVYETIVPLRNMLWGKVP